MKRGATHTRVFCKTDIVLKLSSVLFYSVMEKTNNHLELDKCLKRAGIKIMYAEFQ